MIILKGKVINKIGYNHCAICKQEITSKDINSYNFEYVKSRKGHELFYHTSCIERRKHGNSNK